MRKRFFTRRFSPPHSLPILALSPLLLLTVCFTYVVAEALITPSETAKYPPAEPLSSTQISQISASPETAPMTLPYLLLSASDLPSNTSTLYDILYAKDPPTADAPIEIPDGCFAIVRKNLAYSKGSTLYLSNQSIYKPNTDKLLSEAWQGALPTSLQPSDPDEPIVLIYHTHGTEAFLDEDDRYVMPNEGFRSKNIEENVVAVGKVLAQVLESNGIATVHCTVMHDKDSYPKAYETARQTVISYLARYPTIRYILDVHRDALVTTDGSHIRPVTAAPDGDEVAQVMLVVGTNQSGDHPNWENNLALACKLQVRLNEDVTDFARPINLRKTSFLAEYADGAMLVEIGSAANTLSQAKSAAMLFGQTFADLVKELGTA